MPWGAQKPSGRTLPHLNTDGNREYDFVASGGEADGPYPRSGQAVVDLGFAVLE